MFYAISGYENAETVNFFESRKDRDSFVEECNNNPNCHYTLANCRPATKAQAIKFVGKQSFEYHLKEFEYCRTH